jgi:hypothetical protein
MRVLFMDNLIVIGVLYFLYKKMQIDPIDEVLSASPIPDAQFKAENKRDTGDDIIGPNAEVLM